MCLQSLGAGLRVPADFNSVVSSTRGGFPQIYDNEGKWDERVVCSKCLSGLNYVPLNSYTELLRPKVMEFGVRASGRWDKRGYGGRILVQWD